MVMNQSLSLRLVNEEGNFLELEIKEAIALMRGMASKIIPKSHMPIGAKIGIQETFQVLCHL
jgi:hypothetical protein